MLSLLILLLSAAVALKVPHRAYNSSSSRQKGVINLHLVPHTHSSLHLRAAGGGRLRANE